MDAHCEALTEAGRPCSRRPKHINEYGVRVCTQHLHCKMPVLTLKQQEPWHERAMPTPNLNALTDSAIQKLRRRVKRGPRSNAKGGSIYVYALENDVLPNLYKVGKTSVDVDTRLKQWQRKHKDNAVVKVAEYVVATDVSWVERVVHLYLDYCRVYRYPHGSTLFSVWASTGKPLVTSIQEEKLPSPRSLIAMEKHVEWFLVPFADIDAIVMTVH